jgi:hypothetical protein
MAGITDSGRELLRHIVATLAYRGGKVLRDAPPSFASLRIGEKTRTPVEILAHIGDLLDWTFCLAKGEHRWNNSTPRDWDREVARFFESLARFDALLVSDEPLASSPEKLFQGPIADALTHVGQMALLRRLGGLPVRGENYFRADIVSGRVGPEQSAARREFD